jgi:hypothetical protein
MLTVRVSTADLRRQLRRHPEVLQKVMKDKFRESARLLVSSSGNVPGMVQVTPPFSPGVRGIKAKKQGEAAVMRDVWKVYAPPGKTYKMIKAKNAYAAASYWRAYKARNWKEVGKVLNKILGVSLDRFDEGAEHMRRRNRRGRITGKASVFIRAPGPVRSYIRKRQRNVGLLASSLPAAAGSKLGRISGIPAWISRHSGRWGTCDLRSTRHGERVRIGLTRTAGADMQRRFNAVLSYRVKALQRQTPYIIRHAAKAAGLLR